MIGEVGNCNSLPSEVSEPPPSRLLPYLWSLNCKKKGYRLVIPSTFHRFAFWSSIHVQIDPDVHPVVCDWCIHPHVVRAQQLQIQRRKMSAECCWPTVWMVSAESDSANPHPDLKLQELHIVDCLLKHGADIYFGPVGHQVLQNLQPLIDPFPPFLHNQRTATVLSDPVRKRSYFHEQTK